MSDELNALAFEGVDVQAIIAQALMGRGFQACFGVHNQ
jgi:hypothetical protein